MVHYIIHGRPAVNCRRNGLTGPPGRTLYGNPGVPGHCAGIPGPAAGTGSSVYPLPEKNGYRKNRVVPVPVVRGVLRASMGEIIGDPRADRPLGIPDRVHGHGGRAGGHDRSGQAGTLVPAGPAGDAPHGLPVSPGRWSAGRDLANLNAANIGKQIEVANYEKAIQTAFREVSDSAGGAGVSDGAT